MESSIIAEDQNNQISLHFTQRLYFPYLFEEEGVKLAKIPGMGRINAAQLLWEESAMPIDSGTNFRWWKNPFTKPDIYGF
jgi:hypothetical protein